MKTTHDTCPNTGLSTRKCECWEYDPSNSEARHPSQEWFEDYCAKAREAR